MTYQFVSRGGQLVQQGFASGGLDDVQEAPEVAGVLQPCWLQKVVDGLHDVSSQVAHDGLIAACKHLLGRVKASAHDVLC